MSEKVFYEPLNKQIAKMPDDIGKTMMNEALSIWPEAVELTWRQDTLSSVTPVLKVHLPSGRSVEYYWNGTKSVEIPPF